MFRSLNTVDFEALILERLFTVFAPKGDKRGQLITHRSYFGADIEIVGDDFYEFIEDLEKELNFKLPDTMFAEITNVVPSEGEILSLLWWKRSHRDISVGDLAVLIDTKLQEEDLNKVIVSDIVLT